MDLSESTAIALARHGERAATADMQARQAKALEDISDSLEAIRYLLVIMCQSAKKIADKR